MAVRPNWDKVGTLASALCAVHCLLTGVALGLASIASIGILGSPIAEALFVIAAVLVGSIAVYHGKKRHHSLVPALVFLMGLTLIGIGHFAFGHARVGAAMFSVMGGLSLIGFHWLNMRLQQGCSCTTCPHTHD